MKLRPRAVAVSALVLTVTAPLLAAAPAAATTDPVDPDALAALKAAFATSGQTFEEQGGTVRSAYDLPLRGRTITTTTVIETDANGVSRLRSAAIPGIGGRTESYFSSKGKVVALRVTGVLRRALAKHGLRSVPQWYRPKSGSSTTIDVDLGDAFDEIESGLTALAASVEGDRVTYRLTTSSGFGGSSTPVDITVVADHGLLTSLAAAGTTVGLRYGHAPITVPEAGRAHRKLIQAESTLAGLGQIAQVMIPAHKPRAKRIALLRKSIAATMGITQDRLRLTTRPVRGGVEVTGTIKSWKHPLTWRYLVAKRTVIARPVRTA